MNIKGDCRIQNHPIKEMYKHPAGENKNQYTNYFVYACGIYKRKLSVKENCKCKNKMDLITNSPSEVANPEDA